MKQSNLLLVFLEAELFEALFLVQIPRSGTLYIVAEETACFSRDKVLSRVIHFTIFFLFGYT